MGMPNILALEKSHQACRIIQKILVSDRGQWILDNQHKDSACELSLWTQASNNEIKEYIIDRTFIDQKTNIRWIIDYKTSQPNTNQTLDDFIIDQDRLYKKQLMAYKQLFDAQENPINCALYFPLVDTFHVISP
jgi:hypothetical protein